MLRLVPGAFLVSERLTQVVLSGAESTVVGREREPEPVEEQPAPGPPSGG